MGCIPVARALDYAKRGTGKIYLPDPQNDPTLIRGVGTNFDKEAQAGGLLVLPSVKGSGAASADIKEVVGPEEIRLKKEFKGPDALRQLTGSVDMLDKEKLLGSGQVETSEGFQGSPYKTAPHVDQTKVYDAVFDRLDHGGCVCIFPEGGSHDRTELLPLKGLSQVPVVFADALTSF